MTPTDDPKRAFFDALAERWDGFEDPAALAVALRAGLSQFELAADETVLDVGCGTGNLTAALLSRLSAAGRVVAVDISPAMLARAAAKVRDPRVRFELAGAEALPLAEASVDRVVCYSVWPHFDRPRAVAAELLRVLRPGGRLHVWHLISRQRVNRIHAEADPAVRGDVLVPAAELGELLADCGFELVFCGEDEDGYLVSARVLAGEQPG